MGNIQGARSKGNHSIEAKRNSLDCFAKKPQANVEKPPPILRRRSANRKRHRLPLQPSRTKKQWRRKRENDVLLENRRRTSIPRRRKLVSRQNGLRLRHEKGGRLRRIVKANRSKPRPYFGWCESKRLACPCFVNIPFFFLPLLHQAERTKGNRYELVVYDRME